MEHAKKIRRSCNTVGWILTLVWVLLRIFTESPAALSLLEIGAIFCINARTLPILMESEEPRKLKLMSLVSVTSIALVAAGGLVHLFNKTSLGNIFYATGVIVFMIATFATRLNEPAVG